MLVIFAARSSVYLGWAHREVAITRTLSVRWPAYAGRPGVTSRAESWPRASGTVMFHLTAPDPEFLYELTEQDYAAPVPPGTPNHDMGLDPIPGTGPYRIAPPQRRGEVRPQPGLRVVTRRSARREPRRDHLAPSPDPAAAAAVENGHADWLQSAIPQAAYRHTRIQSPAQLHSHALFAMEFLPFNTNLPPFRSCSSAEHSTTPSTETPSCGCTAAPRLRPPPANRSPPVCPATSATALHLHPRADGAYSGPDLRYAKRLVARSGTRGDHVTVWGSPDEGFVPPRMPSTLPPSAVLGYKATVRLMPIAKITTARYSHLKLSTNGDWLVDYPDPTAYIPQFFSCGGSSTNGYVCDPALDRQMQRAEPLEPQEPTAANALWTIIDHTLTRQAYWVPTVNMRQVDLVSKRLGGYQFNPFWGFLVDQSWIR